LFSPRWGEEENSEKILVGKGEKVIYRDINDPLVFGVVRQLEGYGLIIFLCYSLPYCYMFLRVSYNFGMGILDK
jgi:hypothetical protein